MDHPSLGSESTIPSCEALAWAQVPWHRGFILPLPRLCPLGLYLPFLEGYPPIQTPTGHEIKLTMSSVILTMSRFSDFGNWPTLSPLYKWDGTIHLQECH